MATDLLSYAEAGNKELKRLIKSDKYSETRSVAIVSVYNDMKFEVHEQVCFHSIRQQYYHTNKDVVCVVSNIQRGDWSKDSNKDIARRFLDYLANESILSNAFAIKDPKWMLDNNAVVADTNCASNIMLSGLMAARMLSDNLSCVILWAALVDSGMNKDLAFFLSPILGWQGSNYYCTIDFQAINAFFCPGALTYQCLKDFLSHKCKQKRPFNVDDNYYGLYITWASYVKSIGDLGNYDSSYSTLSVGAREQKEIFSKIVFDFIVSAKKGEQIKVANNNVFAKAVPKISPDGDTSSLVYLRDLKQAVQFLNDVSKIIMKEVDKL